MNHCFIEPEYSEEVKFTGLQTSLSFSVSVQMSLEKKRALHSLHSSFLVSAIRIGSLKLCVNDATISEKCVT